MEHVSPDPAAQCITQRLLEIMVMSFQVDLARKGSEASSEPMIELKLESKGSHLQKSITERARIRSFAKCAYRGEVLAHEVRA